MPKRCQNVHVQSYLTNEHEPPDGSPRVALAVLDPNVEEWGSYETARLTPDEAEYVAMALCHSAAIARHAAGQAPRPRYGLERSMRDALEKVKAAVALRPPRKRGYRQ